MYMIDMDKQLFLISYFIIISVSNRKNCMEVNDFKGSSPSTIATFQWG